MPAQNLVQLFGIQMDFAICRASGLAGTCRYCGKQGNEGVIGNVCDNEECQETSKLACDKILYCGHQCGGIVKEETCLPCLKGCASSPPPATEEMDEAAALLTPSTVRPLTQDAEDMCVICYSDLLIAAPAIQLKCGHVFHYVCCKQLLVKKWSSRRITFSFSRCPTCKEDIDHSSLVEILNPIRELEKEIKDKALARLIYDGRDQGPASSIKNDNLTAYAMDHYTYYMCCKCKKPYFGGIARCNDEGDNPEHMNKTSICNSCNSQVCVEHGVKFMEYKCRFCCSIALFFCLGNSQLCNDCHFNLQHLIDVPIENLPHCPAGPMGVQLDGTEDDCPLGAKHLPTGQEFALGCSLCRTKIELSKIN